MIGAILGGVASGLLSAGGGIIGGRSAKKSARAAREALLRRLGQAQQEMRGTLSSIKEVWAPYQEAGLSALDPLVQEALSTGTSAAQEARNTRAMERFRRFAGKTFGVESGDYMRGLGDILSNIAAEESERRYGRLSQLAGMGMQASTPVSGAMGTIGSAIANFYANMGQAEAGTEMQIGQANQSMFNTIGSSIAGIPSTIGLLNDIFPSSKKSSNVNFNTPYGSANDLMEVYGSYGE